MMMTRYLLLVPRALACSLRLEYVDINLTLYLIPLNTANQLKEGYCTMKFLRMKQRCGKYAPFMSRKVSEAYKSFTNS